MKKLISTLFVSFVFLLCSTPLYSFNDVATTHPNYSAISGLKDMNVISGYPKTNNFMPEKNISRAEFVKILFSYNYPSLDYSSDYMKGLKNCFPDVKESWYSPYVCFYKTLNVVKGDIYGNFNPGSPVNFAEASKLLSISLLNTHGADLYTDEFWYAPYINIFSVLDLVPKTQDPSHNITRAEAVEMIWRIKNLSKEKLEKKSIRHIYKEKDNILHELDILSDNKYLYYYYKETDNKNNQTSVWVNRFFWQADNFNFLDYDTAFSDNLLFLFLTEKWSGKGEAWKPVFVMYGVDHKSFEKINGYYSKDKNHVYFVHEIAKGVDLKTVEKLDENSCVSDKNGVFCQNKFVEGADPDTFVFDYSGRYGTDKDSVYDFSFEKMDQADRDSFKILQYGYAYDKDHLFKGPIAFSINNLDIDFSKLIILYDKTIQKLYFRDGLQCYIEDGFSLEEYACPNN